MTASSINQFCDKWGFSRATWYAHQERMPATVKIGRRVLISEIAIEEWRLQREKEGARDGR